MGIDNLQPCQDDEDEADDLFDSLSSSKAQPEKDTRIQASQLSPRVQQHNHDDNLPAMDCIPPPSPPQHTSMSASTLTLNGCQFVLRHQRHGKVTRLEGIALASLRSRAWCLHVHPHATCTSSRRTPGDANGVRRVQNHMLHLIAIC